MSMLLDLGLFLRENNVFKVNKKTGERTKVTITTAIRGFLFTLACRIGSDPYTWVSQETLAEELDMQLDGIKRLCKKAVDTGLIEIEKNAKDKRKNLYRPAQFLINYTQKRREKLSTVSGFGVFWEPKNVAKRLPKNTRKVAERLPSRLPKGYLISGENNDNIENNQHIIDEEKNRKNHTTTITNKQPELTVSFYPNRENQKLADEIAARTGKTGEYLIRSFIERVINKYNIKTDLDNRFKKFLLTELPVKNFNTESNKPTRIAKFL